MQIRRFVLSMLVLLVAAACGEAPTTPAPAAEAPRPNFLRWSPQANARFEMLGALDGTGSKAGSADLQVVDLAGVSAAPAPVVVDAASSATASTQSLAWTHTVGAGANRFLLVGVSIRNGGNRVTGVTYAGRALTFVGAQNNHDSAVRMELWRLAGPPTGSGDVRVSLTGGAKVVGGAVSFANVDPVQPLGAFASIGGSDNTIDPAIDLGDAVGDGMAFAVVAVEGAAKSLTPAAGQAAQYTRFYGLAGGDVGGAGSVASGAAAARMSWAKGGKAKWSIGAVVLRRAPNLGVAVDRYEARFWAVRGSSRTVQINYVSNGSTSPFLRFTAVDPKYVPGVGNLAMGDSVLITVRVDSTRVGAQFLPAGLEFGSASSLTFWYGGIGGDLNGDGAVNATDTDIELRLLGMWYRTSSTSLWEKIGSTVSTAEKSVTSPVWHFSEYAVSW